MKQNVKMAHDLGAIRNALGILSDDRKKVRPKVFISVTSMGPTETANQLHVSRPSVYKEEVTVSKKLMDHIVQLVMATDLAFELLNESQSNAGTLSAREQSIALKTTFQVLLFLGIFSLGHGARAKI